VRYDASAQELLTAVVTLINFDISVNSKFLDRDTERTVDGYQRGSIHPRSGVVLNWLNTGTTLLTYSQYEFWAPQNKVPRTILG
jgi:hypothetical protein